MAAVARPRMRNMQLETPAIPAPGHNSKVSQEMRDKGKSYYLDNKAANRSKSAADKTRKTLYSLMKDAKVTSFDLDIKDNEGKDVTLEVKVGASSRMKMDAHALFRMMGCDKDPAALKKFLDICTVTKDAVETHFGTAIASRIEVPTTGEENVTVAAKK